MASQPDISAILAALAQRPGGTPGQAPQPPPQASAPAPYPPSQSAPPQSNPLSGLSLPQPSHSGSLDLSAIKPINAGTVSLADAIAKAKGIAADRATREDPRYAGRHSQTRDRSRSPGRRDAFRDKYNPYRDERRDDQRRGANGRDRSFSPNRSAPAAQPPPGSYGSRAGTNESSSEVITVESSSVGLIIGRAGENMRRIESESGARVQFITGPESSGPMRQCRITGTPRQRADAIADIYRTAAENPKSQGHSRGGGPSTPVDPPLREGERSSQIMVPDRTVGLIIGRGGETIRDLQERSGCHVNIVGENKSINGLRPVNLIGSPQAAAKAKEMIFEIVESDTRGDSRSQQQQQPPPAQAYPPPMLQQQPPPQQPPQPGAPHPHPYDPYTGAYDPYNGGQQRFTDATLVPSEAVGMIIGKGGETIKDMQNVSGCKINVSQPSGADIERHIELIGSRSAIDHAKRLIWEKVQTVREKQGGLTRGAPSAPYQDPYAQHHQPPSYGQPPPMAQPAIPPPHVPEAPQPNDPYAAYGGYQNYMAMWAAASAYQGHGQGQPGA